MKVLVVITAAVFLSACESESEQQIRQVNTETTIRAIKRHEDEAEQSGKNCLARNGIIVRSSWDGRIVDCK